MADNEKTAGKAIATIIDVLEEIPIGDIPRVMNCVNAYLNGIEGIQERKPGRPKGSRNKPAQGALLGVGE